VAVFALPLDCEEEVASDSRFIIQFSKDMDERPLPAACCCATRDPVMPALLKPQA
jgi:hypothetical protein